jgi:hypothetical protein
MYQLPFINMHPGQYSIYRLSQMYWFMDSQNNDPGLDYIIFGKPGRSTEIRDLV